MASGSVGMRGKLEKFFAGCTHQRRRGAAGFRLHIELEDVEAA